MKINEFKVFANICEFAGVHTMGDYKALIKNQSKTYNEQNVCINGVPATAYEIAALELRLRLGIERATARCYNGCIYYTTI